MILGTDNEEDVEKALNKEESKDECTHSYIAPSTLHFTLLASEEQKLYRDYTTWMKEHGSKFDKMVLKHFGPDYRGIIAKEDIERGEQIMYIPKCLLITLTIARQSKIGTLIQAKNTSLIYPNNSLLSSYLLYEQANPSLPWKMLISGFPRDLSNFPIFFTEAEKKLLVGSHFLSILLLYLIGTINDLLTDMKEDYGSICTAVPEFADIASLNDFMRMRTLVNSRIFGIKVDGEENDSVVPFAGRLHLKAIDMFNYKYKSNMTYWTYDELSKGFVVRAKENIKAGEEIYVYYGNKPNSSFLLFYGFVVEDNVNDDVTLNCSRVGGDALKELKQELVGRKYLECNFRVSRNPDDYKFQKFLSYLRLVTFNESEERVYIFINISSKT